MPFGVGPRCGTPRTRAPRQTPTASSAPTPQDSKAAGASKRADVPDGPPTSPCDTAILEEPYGRQCFAVEAHPSSAPLRKMSRRRRTSHLQADLAISRTAGCHRAGKPAGNWHGTGCQPRAQPTDPIGVPAPAQPREARVRRYSPPAASRSLTTRPLPCSEVLVVRNRAANQANQGSEAGRKGNQQARRPE